MKKCFLFLPLLVCVSFHAPSQVVKKGDRLFGGSFSLSFFNIDASGTGYSNAGNVGLMPSFAWAVKENLTLGVKGSISYSRSSNSVAAPYKAAVSEFSAGPGVFLKKYRLLKDQFGIYFINGLDISYTAAKQTGDLFPDPVKNDVWGGSYNFSPGVFYRFSDSFLGEANIGGLYLSYYKSTSNEHIGAGVSFFQYFNLGINYVIGKKK